MISKKLLSKVFNEKVLSYNVINKTEIIVQFVEHDEVINIHELAHKCKEWAYIKGYLLKGHLFEITVLEMYEGFSLASPLLTLDVISKDNKYYTEEEKRMFPQSEPEAIFEACDYILNELSNK